MGMFPPLGCRAWFASIAECTQHIAVFVHRDSSPSANSNDAVARDASKALGPQRIGCAGGRISFYHDKPAKLGDHLVRPFPA